MEASTLACEVDVVLGNPALFRIILRSVIAAVNPPPAPFASASDRIKYCSANRLPGWFN